MVAPLSTAGVSDEVAQELQMPMGPQMLEDVMSDACSYRDGTDTLSESALVPR